MMGFKDAKKTKVTIHGVELQTAVEYRIVATVDTYHVYNGKHYHYDTGACWFKGRCREYRTFDKDEAIKRLEETKKIVCRA